MARFPWSILQVETLSAKGKRFSWVSGWEKKICNAFLVREVGDSQPE